jgi:hypothetical protein
VGSLVDLPIDVSLESLPVDIAVVEGRDQGRHRALKWRHGHERLAPGIGGGGLLSREK